MRIDKTKLKIGLWFTNEEGNVIPRDGEEQPVGAVYAHVCHPLEIREDCFKVREDGGYGGNDKVYSGVTHLSRSTGQLVVAMVNSGDYDLYEALAVLRESCERCTNVLWNLYLPEVDGYAEHSEEWNKCNTVCDFCRDE